MHKLLIAFLFLAVANRAICQEFKASPADSCQSKLEHLLKAAEHLEAAGLADEAQKIRQQVDPEMAGIPGSVPAWQAEIERRRALGIPIPTVLLNVRVIELSQTRLRNLGFDWQELHSTQGESLSRHGADTSNGPSAVAGRPYGDEPRQSAIDRFNHGKNAAGVASTMPIQSGATYAFTSNDGLLPVLDALQKNRVAKVLAEPTLATVSGRAAFFRTGGEARFAVPKGNGEVSIVNRPYGTKLAFVPVVPDNNAIRLTCRIEVSQLDPAHSMTVGNETLPIWKALNVSTAGDFKSGQTVVLHGPCEQRHVSSAQTASHASADATPKTDARPNAEEKIEEIQTLVLVTPEIVEPMVSDTRSTGRGQADPSRRTQ